MKNLEEFVSTCDYKTHSTILNVKMLGFCFILLYKLILQAVDLSISASVRSRVLAPIYS
jgi:hypothetical protein